MNKDLTDHACDEPPSTLSERVRLRKLEQLVRELPMKTAFLRMRQPMLWVPENRLPYAACVYSWMGPPSRSRRMTVISVVSGWGSARSRAA